MEKCERCKEGESQAPHSCPYDQELNDGETICTCCEECEQQCVDDI